MDNTITIQNIQEFTQQIRNNIIIYLNNFDYL